MTEVVRLTGATPALGNYWKTIDWKKVKAHVLRLQMRIAKAVREGKMHLVKSLQWILSHSFYAKLLAVKTVTSNKGARTPGVDGVIWNTPAKKMRGALSLQRKGYKAQPLRRIHILKKDSKNLRPLGIPTMKDRAFQAVYLLGLQPIAETTADKNSYGFRFYRACRDAIGQCFCSLAKSYSPKWILDADIKACFDWIDHKWLLDNIPIDRKMLKQWLECGFVQNRKLYPTKSGTPQGGIISPTIANMTLDGLEEAVRKSCPSRRKVNFIRYADDLVSTADSKELIENNIVPAINDFLKPRGLMLSPEKTRIVRVEEGFDFLGQHLQKFHNKLLITPSKKNTKSFLDKVRSEIKAHRGCKCENMIQKLNPIVRGWSNYHRYIQASETLYWADKVIFNALRRWARRRHSNKGPRWIKKKYFRSLGVKWVFFHKFKEKHGKKKALELLRPSSLKLVRYIKIKGESNAFDPKYTAYFIMRRRLSNTAPREQYAAIS